jgi:UDP-N-acetylmuramoyl-L-alanyl-D-glutamate--2,6-diaminopimelate ligase
MLEGIKAKKYTYGFKHEANFSEKLETQLIGDFNMYNVLASYATLNLLGFDKEKIKEVLKNIKPPRGRFEHFTSPNGVLVIIDYAHTPDALENVLKTVESMKKENSNIISVFGCGGDRDPAKRKVMGKIGATLSDIAIFTSDNPRGENPEKIIEQMRVDLSVEELRKVKSISDRREAILESVKIAKSGDIILCAGKGHEDYQEINGVKNHFDDMEEYKKAYDKK